MLDPSDGLSASQLVGFEFAPVGMAVTSTSGVLIHVNGALSRLLGDQPAALRGRSMIDFTHPDDVPAATQSCVDLNERRSRLWRHECRLVRVTGEAVPVRVITSWVHERDEVDLLVMVVDDISERKAIEAHLEHRALHDSLTGLANRRLFEDRLRHALDRGARQRTSTCVLMIDLDEFKSVNDNHGHLLGDAVLVAFAHRLASVLRTSDTAARIGGDEFAVVLEDSDPARARGLVVRLRAAMAAPLHASLADKPIQFSAGIAHVPSAVALDVDRSRILGEADRSMYADKARRRT
ncbi:GGDEF domain-containing protein [Blastococcus sp. TF02-8]|uniref:GGDEF domain-containing protein n=1 Tax=Blastococcus sp. TF02-8 TaxID=2250574 RepID=UPI000DE84CB9|nr:sensor domain-containing diguanylate cyclase [Blastococcus sp. TF02-8]RBY91922.1 GGDEF domain-containing protein [Blastococcus sp. TF02-8]